MSQVIEVSIAMQDRMLSHLEYCPESEKADITHVMQIIVTYLSVYHVRQ